MRVFTFSTAVLFSLLSLATAAEAATNSISTSHKRRELNHRFSVGVDPLYLLIGAVGLRGDMPVNHSMTIGVGGYYMPPRDMTLESGPKGSFKATAYEVYAGPTFMLTGTTDSSGIYLMPALGYTSAKVEYLGDSASIQAPEVRVVGGYRIVSPTNFLVTLGLGARALQASDIVVKDKTGKEILREKSSLSGLALDVGVSYRF